MENESTYCSSKLKLRWQCDLVIEIDEEGIDTHAQSHSVEEFECKVRQGFFHMRAEILQKFNCSEDEQFARRFIDNWYQYVIYNS